MTDLDKAYDIAERVFVVTNTQGKIFDEIVELIVQDTLDKAVQRVEEAWENWNGPLSHAQYVAAIKDKS